MSDILASDMPAVDALDRESFVITTLSFMLIVGLPAAFWLSLLELANYALSLSISNTLRLIVAGGLIGVLSMIWGACRFAPANTEPWKSKHGCTNVIDGIERSQKRSDSCIRVII